MNTRGDSVARGRSQAFKRCAAVLRRPMLSALLVFTLPGAVLPVATMAQSAGAEIAQNAVAAAVNINSASASELADRLEGIGPSKAEAIVRYREQYGPFESPEELSEVSGIGDSTVERNRDVISIR
jgi:competence protein ComEA